MEELVLCAHFFTFAKLLNVVYNKYINSLVEDFEIWYQEVTGKPIRVEYCIADDNEILYNMIKMGSAASGSSSAIAKAENPAAVAEEMIAAVKRAYDEMK